MAIEIVDVLGLAHEERTRKVIMDTRKMHAWMHYYPNPGDMDDLHCHPGDQTFIVLEGQCTMHFEDGGSSVMDPGTCRLDRGRLVLPVGKYRHRSDGVDGHADRPEGGQQPYQF